MYLLCPYNEHTCMTALFQYYLLPKLLNHLAFQTFDFERT